MVGEPSDPTLTDKPRRGRKSGPDLGVLIDTVVVGMFGLVAVATAHEHWLKERTDVLPITGPLKAWVDQLPAKTLKKVEERLAPTLFVVGLATVVGPDLFAEVRIRAEEKRFKHLIPQQAARGQNVRGYPPAGSVTHGSNGTDQPSRSSAGQWANSIPAVPLDDVAADI